MLGEAECVHGGFVRLETSQRVSRSRSTLVNVEEVNVAILRANACKEITLCVEYQGGT